MLAFVLMKFVSAIVSVALGAAILARDHGLKANRLIAMFLVCNAAWAVGEFFLNQATDPAVAATIFRVMTIGWVPLGVLCMHASMTLSSIEDHPVAKLTRPLYFAVALIIPISMTTNFVIAGAEVAEFGWRPQFNPGMILAYALVATPVLVTLGCWRAVMALPDNGGRLQLARIVFFGISGALAAGTFTAVVLPLLGIAAVGITTTLVALVGMAAAFTLRRYGHALISPEAVAREILDTLEDGVVMVGTGGVVRDANRAFLRMIGIRHARAIGRPVTEWIPAFQDRRDSIEVSEFMEVLTHGGESIPVVVSAPVAFHGSGRLVGQAFLLRDRREIISLQRRLAVSARLAAVGDLSKSISRSINEPVGRTRHELEELTIDWQKVAELVGRDEPSGPWQEAIDEGKELIEECSEGVDRIISIVREIGGFSSDSIRQEFERHALDEIVCRALRIARAHAPEWMSIEARLDSDVLIDCHAEEIERVVTNLLVNAIQALEGNDEKDAHLAVAVARQSGRAILHVEDDGCGIEPDALERVFDPFFTTKPVGKGTGLGLAISYHIVKDHGGEIRVSSIAGRGTSVTVELPRAMSVMKTHARVNAGSQVDRRDDRI